MSEDLLNPETSERYLIGALGFNAADVERELTALPGSAFYRQAYGGVWDAARALRDRNIPVEPVSLSRELARRDEWNAASQSVVARELVAGPGAGLAEHHARIVAEFSMFRRIYQAGQRTQQFAMNAVNGAELSEVLASVHAELSALEPQHETEAPKSWADLMHEWSATMEPDAEHASIYPTPWPQLDAVIGGGLHGGRFTVFGGRPGEGKSTATFNLAGHFADNLTPALFVSAEMSDLEVASRVVARGAQVDLGQITRYELDDYTRAKVQTWVAMSKGAPLWVDSNRTTLPRVKAMARKWKRKHNLGVLVCDYLQIIRTDQRFGTREQEVAYISRELKALARELDIHVVCPVQLNRGPATRADSRPVLSDLRESGQIEQDADHVILLHHPIDDDTKERTGEVTFILAKNRHGPCLDVSLEWIPGYATIRPYGTRWVPDAAY